MLGTFKLTELRLAEDKVSLDAGLPRLRYHQVSTTRLG